MCKLVKLFIHCFRRVWEIVIYFLIEYFVLLYEKHLSNLNWRCLQSHPHIYVYIYSVVNEDWRENTIYIFIHNKMIYLHLRGVFFSCLFVFIFTSCKFEIENAIFFEWKWNPNYVFLCSAIRRVWQFIHNSTIMITAN